MKTCPQCTRTLETSSFCRCSGNADGLYHCCRECAAKKRKDYYNKNKQQIAEAKRKHRTTPDYRTTRNQKRREARAANPASVRADDKRRYERHKESILALCAGYYARNKDAILARTKPRRIAYMKASIEELKPSYVKGLLIQGTTLKRQDIPDKLADAKRLQLLIQRNTKEYQNEKY